jgi:hypothetical protein
MTSIVPKDRTTTVTINCYDWLLTDFVPNTKAVFRVCLRADIMPVAVESVTLEGDDYKQWGSDDSFIDKYICAKLGLVPA